MSSEDDFQLVLRAKRQIQREAALRSFLVAGVAGVAVAAALRFADIDLPFMHPLLFTVLFVSLVLNSDVIANMGLVTRKDLIAVIERHIHNDPGSLAQYSQLKNRR
ncbi:MAG: hypothetical protein ACPHGW_00900 [Pseudohongiellaceae bacterium]